MSPSKPLHQPSLVIPRWLSPCASRNDLHPRIRRDIIVNEGSGMFWLKGVLVRMSIPSPMVGSLRVMAHTDIGQRSAMHVGMSNGMLFSPSQSWDRHWRDKTPCGLLLPCLYLHGNLAEGDFTIPYRMPHDSFSTFGVTGIHKVLLLKSMPLNSCGCADHCQCLLSLNPEVNKMSVDVVIVEDID